MQYKPPELSLVEATWNMGRRGSSSFTAEMHLSSLASDRRRLLLDSLEVRVYVLNPCWNLNSKKAMEDPGKTDRVDALLVAQWLRVGRLPAPFAIDAVYVSLQRLTRFRYHLSEVIIREKMYTLGLFVPGFLRVRGCGPI